MAPVTRRSLPLGCGSTLRTASRWFRRWCGGPQTWIDGRLASDGEPNGGPVGGQGGTPRAIGRIAGMDVLVSTNLTSTNNFYYVLAGTNDAITFASQLSKIESLRDKDSFSDLVRGLYLYGAKTVQPKSLAKMIVTA